jgi:hypothetical protein
MIKTLEPTQDLVIKFTEEELAELNIKSDDEFRIKLNDDGSILLEKMSNIELDLADWPVDLLHYLIKESCERDISVNEVIISNLEEYFKQETPELKSAWNEDTKPSRYSDELREYDYL